jgi:hypothetical protein
MVFLILAAPAAPISLHTVLAQEDDTNYDSRSDEEEQEYVEEEEADYDEEEYEYEDEGQSEAPYDEYYYEDEVSSQPQPVTATPFDDSISMNEHEIVTVNVLANDRAIIGWESTPRITGTSEPSFGQIIINSDNTLTYAPSQIPLPAGYEKTDVIQYTASADGVSSYTGTITLWIEQVNDAPVAYSANHTIKENLQTTIYLEAYDEDNDSVTFTMLSGPEFGKCELDSDSGRLVYTPLFEFSGKETIAFQVSDGTASSSVESIQITVEEVGKESTVATADEEDDEEPEPEEEENEGNPPAENGQPVADAGIDLDILTGEIVTLEGDGSFDDEDSITYSWQQLAGPEVVLSDENAANPVFDAPEVEEETELSFELTVSDGNLTDADIVTVVVLPISIDVIPGTYPNVIILGEPEAEVPVAILGSGALEASGVDSDSLRMGPDLAAAIRHELMDSDGDGLTDHVSYFRTGDLGLSLGDKTACVSGAVETAHGNTVEFDICKNVKVKLL